MASESRLTLVASFSVIFSLAAVETYSFDPSPSKYDRSHDSALREITDPAQREAEACQFCISAGQQLVDQVQSGTLSLSAAIETAVDLCVTFGIFNNTEFDCRWQVEALAPAAVWVVQNNPNFDVRRYCAEILIGPTDCDDYLPNPEEWVVELPDVMKPPVEHPPIPENVPALKILHISDAHVDPLYEEGSESLCDRMICCQSVNGPAEIEAAGPFGSYRLCDTPFITIEETFRHISETHAGIDLVFYTGDTPSHDGWQLTAQGKVDILAEILDLMKQYFGETPIFNVMGNHDVFPSDTFSFKGLDIPSNISTAFFYEQAWNAWREWLPVDQIGNVLSSGTYSASPLPGLRVIGLNNMLGHNTNWFLWSGVPDPSGQLAWLASELQAAEDSGEKVYLLGHVPPGYEGMDPTWGRNFARIVNRYESTIRGQFYGHTHYDEFKLFFNEDGEPSNVGFVAPSLTPILAINPGYRIFYVDGLREEGSTWTLIDHETWVFDLDDANAAGEPTWIKSYEMRSEYQLQDLSPDSIQQWVNALKTEDEAFDKYFGHYFKGHVNGQECDADCRAKLICAALTTDSTDLSNC